MLLTVEKIEDAKDAGSGIRLGKPELAVMILLLDLWAQKGVVEKFDLEKDLHAAARDGLTMIQVATPLGDKAILSPTEAVWFFAVCQDLPRPRKGSSSSPKQ